MELVVYHLIGPVLVIRHLAEPANFGLSRWDKSALRDASIDIGVDEVETDGHGWARR